ncbi:hypothetical protein [Actinoplanes sp. NBRC 101535]|uniref:hypothetical protein n=1 Tax=Actinoplanes sp. NBRC 101535 TaxID=3032196 RepID=UPI0024A0FE7A|nr:hypothetical protein [Actinoplanes sp. NBRC 101535]GLY06953.1 hypothetical protein Acsp01_73320 [Actinoplanes sp. NBRC 101535]
MTGLPPVEAEVTAAAVAALPARLQRRLDTVVEQVAGWTVAVDGDVVTVRPDEQTVVTLRLPVVSEAAVVCSCLLAPRCLHRAAVLSAAPVQDGSLSGGVEERDGGVGGSAGLISSGQADAAGALWEVASGVLSSGIPGAGAVAQAELLRAVHRARGVGLHAAAATAVQVVEHLRAARRDDPGYRLEELTAAVRELLTACHRLGRGDPGAVGVARRDYEAVGDLRLYGLFCEPVRAATGHAGTVTYLADAQGRIWVVSDVKPVVPGSPQPSARTAVDLGEVRSTHHELARGGLRAVNAHASAAGRLSHGRARQAVAAPGAGWFADPLNHLWPATAARGSGVHSATAEDAGGTGLGAQVGRWLDGAALPGHEQRAGHDLAFLDGTVVGADRRGLLVGVDAGFTVVVIPAQEDRSLPYVTNLRQLAANAVGRTIRLVGRFSGARRVAGLAFAAPWLANRHGGHVDLGTVTLTRADFHSSASDGLHTADTVMADVESATADVHATDVPSGAGHQSGDPANHVRAVGVEGSGDVVGPPIHLLRHHLERVVAGGRTALSAGVAADVRRLGAAQLGGAAAMLGELGAAGVRRTRDVFGRLDPHDTRMLARAWLAASVYEQAAVRESMRTAWSDIGQRG